MLEISSSTDLFENTPQKDFIDDGLDDYRSQISQEWKIVPVIPKESPEEETKNEPIKPMRISLEAPKVHTEIIKESTGSQLFSMLQKMTPSSRTVISKHQPKTENVQPPRRKLKCS